MSETNNESHRPERIWPHGVGDDLETAELAHSAEFWQLIEQRRREPTIPWEKAKQELGL